MCRNVEVGNVVVGVGCAFHGRWIEALLIHEGGKRSAGHDRLADDHVSPGSGHPIRADTDLDAMLLHRAVIAALDVVFPSPNELDRSPAQALGDFSGFTLHVRVTHRASAEASAGHLGMKGDLLGFKGKDLGDRRLINSLNL